MTNGGDRVKSGGGPSVWKTFGALALIVGLIVIGGRLWKKHGPAMSRGLSAEAVEVLGKRSLDTRQSIHLVRIGSRILVLGSTAAGLRTLAEVVDPMEVDYLAGLCQRRDADNDANQSFRALFGGRTVVDTAGEASTSVQAAESRSFSQHRRSTTDAAAHEPVLPGRPHA